MNVSDDKDSGAGDDSGGALSRTDKRKRRKKRASDSKVVSSGSNKGIETMYRNAYRAELDLISLAATKANIMISLNGFIISVLMVSGGFIYEESPLFLLPATVFLFTSALSVYFALLAASPEHIGIKDKLLAWARGLIAGKVSLWEFFTCFRDERIFIEGESNVLIYEHRARLSKDDYRDKMRELRARQDDVYDRMSDQLYWLGQMASRKFRMLGSSYSVFRWGLLLSVVAFLSVKSIDALVIMDGNRVVQLRNVGVSRFNDVYEPSAAVQLPDGRLLLVEDEAERAFNLLSFKVDGSLQENPGLDARITSSFSRELSDLEGLAIDANDMIYAITSHSTKKSGKRVPAREQLLRFRVDGDRISDIGFYGELRENLERSKMLRDVIDMRADQELDLDKLNIEGLAFDARGESLLIGFREPTIDGQSLVVTIGNPAAMFEAGEQPEFTDVALLALDGGGIRSLNFDPVLDTYLLVNEVKVEGGLTRPRLWSWSGNSGDVPEEMNLPGLIDLTNVETLDSITVNGQSRLLVSSDDGDIETRSPATYMLLEHEQLWRRKRAIVE